MAASSKAPAVPDDELLSSLSEDGATATAVEDDPFAGMDDLLDSVEEDDSEGWVPTEKGEGLFGNIVKFSKTRSDFAKDGEDPYVPTWTIQGSTISADGETRTTGKYRVIGYGTVLKREMEEAEEDGRAVIGGKAALKYFGEKKVKNGKYAGKPFKHFGLAAQPPAPAIRQP